MGGHGMMSWHGMAWKTREDRSGEALHPLSRFSGLARGKRRGRAHARARGMQVD